MTGSVRMSVQWSVGIQESGAIAAALHSLMVDVRKEPGCLGCQVRTEVGEHATLLFEEDWRDESDLRRELRSARFGTLANLMERSNQHPRVEFTLPGGVRGLDYAVEVRDA